MSDQEFKRVGDDIAGELQEFKGPFGPTPMVYADWTASGRCLKSVENFIATKVQPFYGNTHSNTSLVGNQGSLFQKEARKIIAHHFNANPNEDSVIFCGSGSTAAVNKLVKMLGLKDKKMRNLPSILRPLVLIGPFEHHSNILPWKESCAKVIVVREAVYVNEQTEEKYIGIDLKNLENILKRNANRKLIIGSFSAASNITGYITDTEAVSALLHKYGALSVWDCATAGPHTNISMNPRNSNEHNSNEYKDAMFVSGHKYIGGPSTPGILIVKKNIIHNKVPAMPGGGSVEYVTSVKHAYVTNIEEREEAGSPDLIGQIRLGLVMLAHRKFSVAESMSIERMIAEKVIRTLEENPKVVIVGASKGFNTPRLPVFSFFIKYGNQSGGKDLYYHYSFVCALLNDLFGIQSRGGCMCAGPFSMKLLGLDYALAMKHLIQRTILRPGFTRVSFTALDSEEKINYILYAVNFIASKGYLFLPLYTMHRSSGEWVHRSNTEGAVCGVKLEDYLRNDIEVAAATEQKSAHQSEADLFRQMQVRAEMAAKELEPQLLTLSNRSLEENGNQALHMTEQHARWFVYPWEHALDQSHYNSLEPILHFDRYFSQKKAYKVEGDNIVPYKSKDSTNASTNNGCIIA